MALIKPDAVQAGKVDEILEDVSSLHLIEYSTYLNNCLALIKPDTCTVQNGKVDEIMEDVSSLYFTEYSSYLNNCLALIKHTQYSLDRYTDGILEDVNFPFFLNSSY